MTNIERCWNKDKNKVKNRSMCTITSAARSDTDV